MIDTEVLMDEAVRMVDGESVASLLPPNESERPSNADYLFRRHNAIAELKTMQEEVFTPAYSEKLLRLARSWLSRGLIRAYGRTTLEMQKLPRKCQQEWIRLLTLSLQKNIIAEANRQIRRTKDRLKLPDANGILLLANDSNLSFDPYNLVVLVSNVLKKLHPDGSPQYSSIQAVSFFSINLCITSPLLSNPAIWWFNGHRPSSNDTLAKLLPILEQAWYGCLSSRGYRIRRVQLPKDAIKKLTFI